MDYLDSSIRVVQTVLPPAIQYFGKAKEREAKLTQTINELAQTKAHVEILVIKNHESEAKVEVLTKDNEELSRSVADLEAFKNIVLVLFVIAAVVYLGRAMIYETA